uniref:Ig-like domain-containing protein n=1 Tax=Astyanax mexicanus TaxID=7994 RepID=A0A3B1JCL1_ASTMX
MRGSITKSVGDSVVLPCSCEDLQHNPNTLMWGYNKRFVQGNYKAEHSVFPEDSKSQRYRGRVQRLTQNPPGDLSLIISNLTEEDEGLYLCGVNGKYTTAVPLYIRGCSVMYEGVTSFIKSPGESVLLPCFCPEDRKINPQRVTWFFSVSNETQSYSGRVWMFDQPKSRNFSLLISDLNKDDSGEYRCRADEKIMPYIALEVKGCTLSENKQTVPIIRSSGESVLLSCSCTDPQTRPVSIKWEHVDSDVMEVSNRTGRYAGRIHMFNEKHPANLSLLLSNLTEQDEGLYRCTINNEKSISMKLNVKGKLLESLLCTHTHIMIMLYISADCTLSSSQENLIVGYSGESVLLSCSCTDPQTRPVSIKWEHVDSDVMEVSNITRRYAGRIHMFNEKHPANLSLLLSNLTEQDEGLYRCTINNEKSISMKLNVKGKLLESLLCTHTHIMRMLYVSAGCTLSNSQENLIIGYSGESVLLPCSCTDPQTRPVSIKWERVDSDVMEVSNRTGRYAGRIHMFNEKHPANLSLLLSNLTEQDEGLYRCTINNEKSISMKLNVKGKLLESLLCTHTHTHIMRMLYVSAGCTLSNSQENLIVGYSGGSVLLPCSCTDPQTRPVSIKWEHVDSDVMEVSNRTGRYAGRIHMFNEKHPANLSLLLSNLTEQDEGLYRCTINNEKSISMKLNVKGKLLESLLCTHTHIMRMLYVSAGCTLSNSQENLIIGYSGGSVLLSCSCTDPQTRPVSIKWERVDSDVMEVSNRTGRYAGRIHMFNEKHPANLSLLLSNLTEQDEGLYRCTINNEKSISMKLNVKGKLLESLLCTHTHIMRMLYVSAGCTLSNSQENQIVGYTRGSVLLSCSCTDPQTRPVSIKWEHVDSDVMEVSNITGRYAGRIHMFNEKHPANLSLLLSNLTEQDEGLYRCTINNEKSISMKLNVKGKLLESLLCTHTHTHYENASYFCRLYTVKLSGESDYWILRRVCSPVLLLH